MSVDLNPLNCLKQTTQMKEIVVYVDNDEFQLRSTCAMRVKNLPNNFSYSSARS